MYTTYTVATIPPFTISEQQFIVIFTSDIRAWSRASAQGGHHRTPHRMAGRNNTTQLLNERGQWPPSNPHRSKRIGHTAERVRRVASVGGVSTSIRLNFHWARSRNECYEILCYFRGKMMLKFVTEHGLQSWIVFGKMREWIKLKTKTEMVLTNQGTDSSNFWEVVADFDVMCPHFPIFSPKPQI